MVTRVCLHCLEHFVGKETKFTGAYYISFLVNSECLHIQCNAKNLVFMSNQFCGKHKSLCLSPSGLKILIWHVTFSSSKIEAIKPQNPL